MLPLGSGFVGLLIQAGSIPASRAKGFGKMPKQCLKSEMVREHSGQAERAKCRLPFGHTGSHQFADSEGDISTRAWKPQQSCEARLRIASIVSSP